MRISGICFMLIAFLLLGAKGNKNDERLLGKWRSPAPSGLNHSGMRHEFIFESKGKFLANRILYEFDRDLESWSPYTAEQPANGYDDTWETHNGFLTIKVREKYTTSVDQFFRYTISGDTLRLWKGEIFEGDGDSLTGNWTYEIYDQSQKDELRKRSVTFAQKNLFIEHFPTRDDSMHCWQTGSLITLEAFSYKGQETKSFTKDFRYTVADDHLYLWEEEMYMEFIKR